MELEITVGTPTGNADMRLNMLDPTLSDAPGAEIFQMPYKSVLCFGLVFDRVEELVKGDDIGIKFIGEELLRRAALAPEIRGPIDDLNLLKQHRDIMELLMLFIIPPSDRENSLYKFSQPFHFAPIYVSPRMKDMITVQDACYSFSGRMEDVVKRHQIMLGATILKKFYGVTVDVTPTAMLTVPDHKTGLSRYFKPDMNADYIKIVPVGDFPDLSRSDINRLLTNISDTELWMAMLPAEKFEFHGLHISHLLEVTEEEALSRLKQRLISRDAILDVERVRELAQLVRIHFKNPDLQLGLTAVDFPLDRAVDHEYRIRFNILSDSVDRLTGADFAGSIYEKAFKSKEVLVVEDLRSLPHPTRMERELMRLGFRSFLIAPLLDQDKNVIGVVELGCPGAYGINAFLELKFREIRGLFRTAIERSREYIDNRIEAIMREQYTSLHSSVEWRFTEAAFEILQQLDQGLTPVSPAIAFSNVYPLYGQADIVGSSGIRNAAIYQDLVDNLRAGRYFLSTALNIIAFPLIHQVIRAIDDALETEVDDFDNGHEIRFGELIHAQLSPLINQLARSDQRLRDLGDRYFEDLDPELGLFARIRMAYEKSVARINNELSEFFTTRDLAMQATLPP